MSGSPGGRSYRGGRGGVDDIGGSGTGNTLPNGPGVVEVNAGGVGSVIAMTQAAIPFGGSGSLLDQGSAAEFGVTIDPAGTGEGTTRQTVQTVGGTNSVEVDGQLGGLYYTSPRSPLSNAGWDPQYVLFVAIDNENGDDAISQTGILAAANSTFTAGQWTGLTLKTLEELRARIPRIGCGRKVLVMMKPRSDNATFKKRDGVTADYIDPNYDDYGGFKYRGSNDFSNGTNDLMDCGGVTDNTGPNVADGSWTVTAQAGFQITIDNVNPVGGPMNLPSEALLCGNKCEFQGNVTAAARTQSQIALKRISNTVFETGNAQTLAAGDKLFFRMPGVRVDTVLNAPTGKASFSTSTPTNVDIIGVRFASAVGHWFHNPPRFTFCRFDASFNPLAGSQGTINQNYRDMNGTIRSLNCGIDARSTTFSQGPMQIGFSVFHGAASIVNNPLNGFILSTCNFLALATIGGTAAGPGQAATGVGAVVGLSGSSNSTRFGAGCLMDACRTLFDGIDLAGATKGFYTGASSYYNDVAFKNVTGALAANISGVDLSLALQSRAVFLTGNTYSVSGTGSEILMAGAVTATLASLATSPQMDDSGNIAQGSAGCPVKRTVLKFSGDFVGAAGAKTDYLADSGPIAASVLDAVPVSYPMPACRVRNLRVTAPTNPLGANLVFRVLKNGAATGITATITAGSTALFSDLTHEGQFAAGDLLDIDMTETGAGTAKVAATLECF